MSAYKTATIHLGEAEYQRLREAEEQLRLLTLQNRDPRRHISNQQNESIYERMLKDQKKRDQAFQSFQYGLSDEIGALESRTNRMIQDQANLLQRQIDSSNLLSIGQFQNQIDQWLANIQNQISYQEQSIHQTWEDQDQRIANIEARGKDVSDTAANWIQGTCDIIEMLQDQYVLNAGDANELAMQRQSIDLAIQQHQSRMYELAAMIAFQAYFQSSRLRAKLESEEQARLLKIKTLENTAQFVIDQIRDNRIVLAMDNEGNLLDDSLEVDFWTDGQYTALIEKAEQLNEELRQLDHPDPVQMQSFENELNLLQSQSIELATQARLAVLASQLRFNVAQIIVRALESQGFYLEHASYQQGDFRDSFIATTRNFSGNEVVVTLDPDVELDEGGRLQIVSTDAEYITQHELLQRNQEIFAAIESQGVYVGNIQSHDGKPANIPNRLIRGTHQKRLHTSTGSEKY